VLGHAPLSASPVSAAGLLAVRHVIVEAGLPTTVRERSDAVYYRVPATLPAGGAVDLSLAAVAGVFVGPDGTRAAAQAAVEDPARGLVRVLTPTGFLTAAGRWKLQVVVTWPDGGVFYTPPGVIRVRPNL
jgi:hypothetical protein